MKQSISLNASVTIVPIKMEGVVLGILQTNSGYEYRVRYFDAQNAVLEVWFLPSEIVADREVH